jgi:hypothetical protein
LFLKMKSFTEPARIAWALIWRATLLAPAAVIFTSFYIGSWIARFCLPILILISMWAQDWLSAAVYGVPWLFCMALWQWKRYRSLWEAPPSLL